MKPETKTFTIILGYCSVLWATNWSFTYAYARKVGLLSSGLDLRGLGAVVGLLATVVLAVRFWRVTRILFDAGVRIPKSIRLWGPSSRLWLLLPLAFRVTHYSGGTADDGAGIQTVFEYGGGASGVSILFSATAILLFQLLVSLEAFNPENQQSDEFGEGAPQRILPPPFIRQQDKPYATY